jgi:hypothetical protein
MLLFTIDSFEQKFDYGYVVPNAANRIHELQQRVRRMEGVGLSHNLELLPALASVVTVRTGTSCAVDSPSLALALAAGPSQAGGWVGLVGMPDLGWEAAQEFGVDLSRTIAVPNPGEHWLSVTAGLIDVATMVVVRPPCRVGDKQAASLSARMRPRGAVLIVDGHWPRSALTLTTERNQWRGIGLGLGHLTRRVVTVSVQAAGAPVRQVNLGLPTVGCGLELLVDEATVTTHVLAG